MPGMLPGMQALTHITHFCQAAVLHALLPAQLCMLAGAPESGPSAHGGGALVVGTVKVPLPGGPTLRGPAP